MRLIDEGKSNSKMGKRSLLFIFLRIEGSIHMLRYSKEEIKEDDSKEVLEISNEANITLSADVDFVIVNE